MMQGKRRKTVHSEHSKKNHTKKTESKARPRVVPWDYTKACAEVETEDATTDRQCFKQVYKELFSDSTANTKVSSPRV